MLSIGRKLVQTAGRAGWPKRAQRESGRNCTQGTPAGLPQGRPGIGVEIEGAMQQAPQSGRQSITPIVVAGRRGARAVVNAERDSWPLNTVCKLGCGG